MIICCHWVGTQEASSEPEVHMQVVYKGGLYREKGREQNWAGGKLAVEQSRQSLPGPAQLSGWDDLSVSLSWTSGTALYPSASTSLWL